MDENELYHTSGERNEPVSADAWGAEPASAAEPEAVWYSEPAEEAAAPEAAAEPAERSWYEMPREEPAAAPAQAKKEKKARKGMSTAGIVALCLVCAIVASVASAGVTYAAVRKGGVAESVLPTAVPVIGTVSYEGASNETAASIYELAKQQVVGINTEVTYTTGFFGQTATGNISGSGFIITEDGYIVTNYHVIEDAYEGGLPVTVVMYDETAYEAEIVGFDEDNDIALLKIDAAGLNPAQLGDSDSIIVGQTVYAVGNALGELTYTMTSGIISALGRRITTDEAVIVNMFQVDAAINNGNSGGPVFNVCGQVIGVVTAKYTQFGMEGLGFAIPINDACRIADDLVEKGYVTGKAYLGMSFANVSPSVARYYDMVQGVYISVVEAGSCSETAGLQPGDIITAIDGVPVATTSELVDAVRAYRAGDSAEFTVWRSKQTLSVTVVFDEELPAERVETETNVGRPSFEPDMRES